MQKIFTFSRNAEAISPKSDVNRPQSRKYLWNCGHPGELTIAKPRPAKTTTLLSVAMRTARCR
jgi:hypothetical protein